MLEKGYWKTPDRNETIPQAGREIIAYVGCVHGGSPESLRALAALAEDPLKHPDILILGGDIPGAANQKTIRQKQLFYDYFMNRVNAALSADPELSSADLLNQSGPGAPEDSPTIRDGILKLLSFALRDMGGQKIADSDIGSAALRLAYRQIAEHPLEGLTEINPVDGDKDLASYIDWVKGKKLNSGTWVATLPAEIRQTYAEQYVETATALHSVFAQLQQSGTRIFWLEGNEDNPESISLITNGLDVDISPSAMFDSLGIRPIAGIEVLETEHSVHILVPFFAVKNETYKDRLKDLFRLMMTAEEKGKRVIMVTHLQPDWSVHYPGQAAKGEEAVKIERLHRLIDFFGPDTVVYPHQHWEIKNRPHPDAVYELRNGSNDKTPTDAYFLPLTNISLLTVSRDKRRRFQSVRRY